MTIKGFNTLSINEATMREAMQLYLNSLMVKSDSVRVTHVVSRLVGGSTVFDVSICEVKEDEQ